MPPTLGRDTHHGDAQQHGVALQEDALDLVALAVVGDAHVDLHRERLLHLRAKATWEAGGGSEGMRQLRAGD